MFFMTYDVMLLVISLCIMFVVHAHLVYLETEGNWRNASPIRVSARPSSTLHAKSSESPKIMAEYMNK